MNCFCSVEKGLKKKWPKNLSVKHLEIIGSISQSDIVKLGTIECELNLTLDCVAAEQMYQLLERIGRLVKSLVIANMYKLRQGIVYIKTEMILERILSACPNLEHFEFATSRTVVPDDRYKLQPAAFKNYKK